MDSVLSKSPGDPWFTAACIDRLIELGLLEEAEYGPDTFLQHRIFYRE